MMTATIGTATINARSLFDPCLSLLGSSAFDGVVSSLFFVVTSIVVTLGVSVGSVVGFIVTGKENKYENEQIVSFGVSKVTRWKAI